MSAPSAGYKKRRTSISSPSSWWICDSCRSINRTTAYLCLACTHSQVLTNSYTFDIPNVTSTLNYAINGACGKDNCAFEKDESDELDAKKTHEDFRWLRMNMHSIEYHRHEEMAIVNVKMRALKKQWRDSGVYLDSAHDWWMCHCSTLHRLLTGDKENACPCGEVMDKLAEHPHWNLPGVPKSIKMILAKAN